MVMLMIPKRTSYHSKLRRMSYSDLKAGRYAAKGKYTREEVMSEIYRHTDGATVAERRKVADDFFKKDRK